MTVTERIKSIYKAKGISVRSLEAGCDFPLGYLSNVKTPSIDRLEKTGDYLGVSANKKSSLTRPLFF